MSEINRIEETSVHSIESSTSLQSVSFLTKEPASKGELKVNYCKPRCRMRQVKNKEAILILVWNYLLMSILFFNTEISVYHFNFPYSIQYVLLGLMLPFAGWLADVYFGRFKVIRFCIWMMWISVMLATLGSVSAKFLDEYSKIIIDKYLIGALMTLALVGLGGFQSNVIQFGIDQLHDASTSEITSFISWYVWTASFSGLVVQLSFTCISKEYYIIRMLVMCIYVSLALSLMFIFNHVLIREPVTQQNPFKLVYNVVKHAIKNKHPRCRSAFTYCEDDIPSRIDFGKSKYGGPFTTEQVEDVKTFLRILPITSVASIFFSEMSGSYLMTTRLLNLLSIDFSMYGRNEKQSEFCYTSVIHFYIIIFRYSWVFFLPVHELFFYPILQRCMVIIKNQWNFLLAVLLQLVATATIMLIEVEARSIHLKTNNTTTVQCVGEGILSNGINYRWLAIPLILQSLSMCGLGIGIIQFVAAQAPYSMRGLIMGTAYSLYFLFAALGFAISIPVTLHFSIWNSGVISCRFWYALLLLAIEIISSIVLLILLKKYKWRKREDVLPNEHIFAERYYDTS